MNWLKNLLMRWLWGVRPAIAKHNPADFNIGMIRFACNELLVNFSSFAEQCWDEGRKDELEQLQLLASWFCQELRSKVGHPPTIH